MASIDGPDRSRLERIARATDVTGRVEFMRAVRHDHAVHRVAFHHDRDELWIVTRKFEVPGRCVSTSSFSETCRSMAGSTTLLFAPGTADQTVEILQDAAARHFMRRPPALAMADNNQFAISKNRRAHRLVSGM